MLLLGLVSSNLLPGDKRLGHNHHHHGEHHLSDHHHPQHHHDHHHEQPPDSPQLESQHQHPMDHKLSESRRPGARSGKELDLSQAELDQDTGLRCVRMETSLVTRGRESLLTCRHRSVSICHITYVTKFRPFTPRHGPATYFRESQSCFYFKIRMQNPILFKLPTILEECKRI